MLDAKVAQTLSLPIDPRIGFALFSGYREGFASIKAYSKDSVDQTLTAGAMEACDRRVTMENDNSFTIDDIFKKFMDDFASAEEGLLRWLSKCVEDGEKKISLYFASIDKNILQYSFKKVTPTLNEIELPTKKRLDVDIYIESLCADVHSFFEHQLEPWWKTSPSLINLNIITFGKGSVTPINEGELFNFECQNGADECKGNKLMTCVTAYYPVGSQISMLTCMMTSPAPSEASAECAKSLGLPLAPVRECSQSVEGSQLLYDNGVKTLALEPKLFFVPTVTVNQFYNSSTLEDALRRFPDFICEHYIETNTDLSGITTPPGCKVKLEVYFESVNLNVKKFFLEQLHPVWNRVQGAIDLRLIPFRNTTLEDYPEINNGTSEEVLLSNCVQSPLECYDITEMGCVVAHLPIDKQMSMFVCLLSKTTASMKGQECARQEGVDWNLINECVEGSQGQKLFKELGLRAAAVAPFTRLPTVIINKISNATFTDWAIHDLLALVCDAYLIPSVEKVTLPKGCPVRLEIYFEMLCPDTSRFFLKVFDPFWKRLRSITDLHLIPFGKANVWLNEEGTDYEFQCQYGPAECQQNKIASCVIEYLPVDLQFEFLTCMMQDKTDGEVGQKCAERLSIAWEPLQECATTREGSTLLFHNGARTMNLKPRLFFVPTVTINGFYDVDQLERSLNSLDDLICEAYMTPFSRLTQVLTPKGCKLQVIIFFTTASKESSIFILVQIAPVWKKLGSRVLNIEFIPLGSDGNHLDKHCHGNAECTLDQIFACAVVTYSSTEQLEFLTCIYQYNATLEASKKCSQILGLSWDRLSRCQRGSHGPSLLETNIKKANALRPSLHTLPTVVLNGYYDKSHLKESLEDLMSQVCSSFYDPTELTSKVWKPRGCPVTVEVYLQSLCPNSKRFFLNQLVPAWKKLHSVIDLKIIPFGKATGKLLNPDTGEYQFACQHGPLECHGNKVFSCIVKHMSVHDQMKIFECLYMKQFPAIEGRECAEKLGLNWGGVLNCIDEDGSRLLYENGWLTGNLKPSVFFIPTITINKFYSKAALRQTLRDLSGVVCETYLADDGNSNIEVGVPEGCKVSLTIFFHSLDDQMKFVFSQEIEEIWRIFQNILNLRFVPISGSSLLPSQNSTDTTEKSSNSFCDIYDNECYVSKALSCLTLTQTADIQMKFLACLMSQDDLRRGSVAQCARELFLDSGDLDECATVKGAEILKENDKHFGNYLHRAKALPLVVVNKAVIKEQSNLRRVTCLHYKGPKPQECNHSHSNYTKDKSTH